MTSSRLIKFSSVLLVILTTGACQVTPSAPPQRTSPAPVIDSADPAVLLKQATSASPGEAARLRLQAAQIYLADGATSQTHEVLDRIDPATLDGPQQFAFYQIQLRVALAEGDFDAAHQALALSFPVDKPQRNEYALDSADLAEAEQRFEDAAIALMSYAFTTRDADNSKNQMVVDRIWEDVNRTPIDRMTLLVAGAQNPTAEGWWKLAIAVQSSFDLQAERDAIAAWQRMHRSHPASQWLPSALTLIDGGTQPPNEIALLLPVTGGLGAAGRAVRDGFLAAYYHGRGNAAVRIYDTSDASMAGLYEQASLDGADVIVGPLDKSQVADMNAVAVRTVPVLALNYLPPGVTASPGLVQFGLAIEDEARAIARRMRQDGLQRVVVFQSDLDWSGRAGRAFRDQFEADGGTVIAVGIVEDARLTTDIVGNLLLVDASTARMESLARTIGATPEFVPRRRGDVEAVAAFVDPTQARGLNPALAFHFATDIPVYATSQAAGSATRVELAELDGFRLTELPWQVYPSVVRNEVDIAFGPGQAALAPLYALGVDAYRLADRTSSLLQRATALLGETGQLRILADGAVVRDPAWAVVSHGKLVALPTVAP